MKKLEIDILMGEKKHEEAMQKLEKVIEEAGFDPDLWMKKA